MERPLPLSTPPDREPSAAPSDLREARWRRRRPLLLSAGATLMVAGILLSGGWPIVLCGFALLYVAAAPVRARR
jgi:Flp pilus assembly protein TadB